MFRWSVYSNPLYNAKKYKIKGLQDRKVSASHRSHRCPSAQKLFFFHRFHPISNEKHFLIPHVFAD